MSNKMAGILIGFGIVLAGLGLAVQKTAPAMERVAFIAGVAGGGLSLLWGVAALAGLKSRQGAILTAIATIAVLLIRGVHVWTTSMEAEGGALLRLVVTMMFVMTTGMLLYLFHGERAPEFYQRAASRHDDPASAKVEEQSQTGRLRR